MILIGPIIVFFARFLMKHMAPGVCTARHYVSMLIKYLYSNARLEKIKKKSWQCFRKSTINEKEKWKSSWLIFQIGSFLKL